jgi:hypothetical protein
MCCANLKREVSIPHLTQFFKKKGETPAKVQHEILIVYGDVMNRQNVAQWCNEFNAGRTDVHDEQNTGRPSLLDDYVVKRV